MDRINPEGIPRSDLSYYLTRPDYVKLAVQTDTCLLCRNKRVNEAGLCDVCTSRCSYAELDLIEKWCAGLKP